MSSILELVRVHSLELFKVGRCNKLQFHNADHVNDVVEAIQVIANCENLSVEEIEILTIAAYFHDTGLNDIYKGHEYVSKANAKRFLENQEYPKGKINKVLSCIMATKMPQKPKTILQKVMCDADLSHLGSESYFKKNEALRKEWEMHLQLTFSEEQWRKTTIDFLLEHTYFTKYGNDVLTNKKRQNIMKCFAHDFEA